MQPLDVILAHGGHTGAIDMFVGIGPVLIGCAFIGYFVLLLASDESSSAHSGRRDETPTPGRLVFSGAYYHLEEMLSRGPEEPNRRKQPVDAGG